MSMCLVRFGWRTTLPSGLHEHVDEDQAGRSEAPTLKLRFYYIVSYYLSPHPRIVSIHSFGRSLQRLGRASPMAALVGGSDLQLSSPITH